MKICTGVSHYGGVPVPTIQLSGTNCAALGGTQVVLLYQSQTK